MLQLVAEIAPERHTMARRPPGGQHHIHKKQHSDDTSRPHPQPDQQRDADQQLDNPNHVSEENGVRQYKARQNRPIKTHGTVSDVILQVSLESAVSKLRPRYLVLAK